MDIDAMNRQLRDLMVFKAKLEPLVAFVEAQMKAASAPEAVGDLSSTLADVNTALAQVGDLAALTPRIVAMLADYEKAKAEDVLDTADPAQPELPLDEHASDEHASDEHASDEHASDEHAGA